MFARLRQVVLGLFLIAVNLWIVGCVGLTGATHATPPSASSPSNPGSSVKAPTIQAHATPPAIAAGQSSTLSWSSMNADSVTIDTIGKVAPNGSQLVSPMQTTTYSIQASNPGGNVTATVMITVNPTAPTPAPVSGQVSVPTWHMDNGRSGLNDQETLLKPANVQSGKFGKLFSYIVDGYLYAQPLYDSGLNINGAKRNVVFAATEYDSVYAFDADNFGDGTPLWKTSLLQNGETPQHGGNPKPWIGITSTPVIDLHSQTMFVVSAQQGVGEPFFRLHALDITSGRERTGSPVVINASAPGTNSDSANGTVSLTSACLQRTALLLDQGTLYFGFSACHSGWLLSYSAADLKQMGVLNMSPNDDGYGTYGGAGGVWMGGGGPVADGDGFVYVTTGNGPYNGSTAWGESVLKLDSHLNIVDHFTPYDWAFLQCKDLDLSGGGAMLIPGTTQLLAGGKGGKIYVVNATKLGGVKANDAGASQTLWFNNDHYPAQCTNTKTGEVYSTEIAGYQIFSTAAFFNGSVYLGTTAGPVEQFSNASGQLTFTSSTDAQIADGTYGTTPFISANGTSDGIVWMLDHGAPIQDPINPTPSNAILRAYDASNLSLSLYDSSRDPADMPGYGIKFTSPIVANGRVFIGAAHDTLSSAKPQGEIDVYGLR